MVDIWKLAGLANVAVRSCKLKSRMNKVWQFWDCVATLAPEQTYLWLHDTNTSPGYDVIKSMGIHAAPSTQQSSPPQPKQTEVDSV